MHCSSRNKILHALTHKYDMYQRLEHSLVVSDKLVDYKVYSYESDHIINPLCVNLQFSKGTKMDENI